MSLFAPPGHRWPHTLDFLISTPRVKTRLTKQIHTPGQKQQIHTPGCAGQARNPKGPQVTPFCHQMGRHPTVLDISGAEMHRIPARISPWGSRGLNPNFLFTHFGPNKCPKVNFLAGFRIYVAGRLSRLFPGAQGAPQGAQGGPRGPLGPLGAPGPPAGGCP